MQVELKHLPPTLREIAELIGIDPALALAEEAGGQEVEFPEHRPGKWLVELIGRDPALRLGAHFCGLKIILPTARHLRQRMAIASMLERGDSQSVIARKLGLHIRTIRRHAAQLKALQKEPPEND